MKRLSLALVLLSACAHVAKPPSGLSVSEAFTHRNLTLYLILDQEAPTATPYLTLQEALRRGEATLSELEEGAEVNTLEIENRSERPLYIQAGEIAAGGNQDRTIARDIVVPPHSGRKKLAAFCIEPTRWSPRRVEGQAEPSGESSGSALSGAIFDFPDEPIALPTRELKLAVQLARDQEEVWARIGDLPKVELVPSDPGDSSLALVLEGKELRRALKDYVAALEHCVADHPRAAGMAVAINGRLTTVERYSSTGLFRKFFPTLLRCAAVEAQVKQKEERSDEPVTPDLILRLVKRTRAEGWVLFESRDKQGAIIHEQMIRNE